MDVILGYVKLQKKGADYFGLCPFHNEKSPSFSASPGKQMYYRSGCGTGGNVITFPMEYEDYILQEAPSSLADRAGANLPEMEYGREVRERTELRARPLEVNKLAANYFYYQMEQPRGEPAYDYSHPERGLAGETVVYFGLGHFSKASDDLYHYLKGKGYEDSFLKDTDLMTLEERGERDKLWNRVMSPVMGANNRVTGFGGRVMGDGEPKYLNSPETKLFDKSCNLYGLNYARFSRERHLLIYEGYLDIIPLHQAGFTNAMASLDIAFTSQHANVLRRHMDRVVLTYGSDGAGVKAALRAIPILKEMGMSIKALNVEPCKDPDKFIKSMGAETFRQRIREAKNSFFFEMGVLRQGCEMNDPEQKTRLYQETVRELLQFGGTLEWENYPQAVTRERMILADELRGLVNRMGMSMGFKVGENLSHSGRVVPQEAEEGGLPGSGSGDNHKPRRPDKEDEIHRSQRLLLTRFIETPVLFEKIEGVITADDSVENLYRQVAQVVFDGYREGNLNPAAILSWFINDEDRYKEVVTLFSASSKESLDNKGQKKAFSETVMKVGKNSLGVANRNTKDTIQLQKITRQQVVLEWLHISLD